MFEIIDFKIFIEEKLSLLFVLGYEWYIIILFTVKVPVDNSSRGINDKYEGK